MINEAFGLIGEDGQGGESSKASRVRRTAGNRWTFQSAIVGRIGKLGGMTNLGLILKKSGKGLYC